MESEATGIVRKRVKLAAEEIKEGNGAASEIIEKEQCETHVAGSEEMEFSISCLLGKIERFSQQVAELLESGKTVFKDLSNEFEERLILIYKERMEKWEEEIKELRMLDALNEEANARLYDARNLLQHVRIDS